MFKKLLQFGFSIIRHRKLSLDPSLTDLDLLYLAIKNLNKMMRGLLFYQKFMLVGAGTSIYKANFGSGAYIGDYVVINGIGKKPIQVGNNFSLGSFSLVRTSGSLADLGMSIHIGNNVGIGDFAHIGGAGGLIIGNDTIIGSYFSVHPENHNFSDPSKPIRLQGVNRLGVKIGNGCWIGAKVTILDGSIIGNNCVVAAGSVVRGFFPDYCVIAGVPAKIIKKVG